MTGRTPSVGTLRSLGKEPEGREHALLSLLACDVATLDADRIRSEAKAHRSDAGVRGRRIPVRDQPVLGIGGVPEEAEGTLLELQNKRVDDGARRTFHRILELHLPRFPGRRFPSRNDHLEVYFLRLRGHEDHDHKRRGHGQWDADTRVLSGHRHLSINRGRAIAEKRRRGGRTWSNLTMSKRCAIAVPCGLTSNHISIARLELDIFRNVGENLPSAGRSVLTRTN